MTPARLFRVSGMAAIALAFSVTSAAQTGDPAKDLLFKRLNEQFVPTVFNQDETEIVTPGSVVALKVDGHISDYIQDPNRPRNGLVVYRLPLKYCPITTYKKGTLSMGFMDSSDVSSGDNLNITQFFSFPRKYLQIGDKVWISGFGFGKNTILATVVTDPYDDGRYCGMLKFPYEKGHVPTPDEAVNMISEVITVVSPDDQGGRSAPVQSSDPKVAAAQRIRAAIKLTETTTDRSDISTAGDVVEIHRPGLLMYGLASPIPPANAYKNGMITQGWSNFGRGLLGGMLPGGQTPENYPQRKFMPGERLWVTGFEVQRDGVTFQLYSDPYDDIRYCALLKIPFPNKNEIPPADTVMQLVAEVLTVVPPDDQAAQPADQGAQQAPAPNPAQDGPPPPIAGQYLAPGGSHMLLLADGSFTKFVGGGQGHGQYAVDGNNLTLTFSSTGFAQHFKVQGGNLVDVNTQQVWARTGDAPLPDIAPPPPPPADTPPPTIAIGQTMDQVTAGFGQPLKLAKVGAKTIFYYKDMKVTFTNGKVSNVE